MKLINYAFKVFWDAGIRLSLLVWVGQAQFEGAAEAAEAGPLPASLAITCPTNVTVQCAAALPAPAADSASFIAQGGTISENCGAVTIPATDVTNNQTCANRFTITRTYSVMDSCGNSAMCDQTITVNDTNAPVITC